MSEIVLKHTGVEPITPTVGKSRVYLDASTKLLASKDDDGVVVIYSGGAAYLPFDKVILGTGYQILETYDIIEGASRLEITVVANQDDCTERAVFKRVILLYVPLHCGGPGQVFSQNPYWLTPETQKSNSAIDIQYELLGTTITIKVRNASGVKAMRWVGHASIINSR